MRDIQSRLKEKLPVLFWITLMAIVFAETLTLGRFNNQDSSTVQVAVKLAAR